MGAHRDVLALLGNAAIWFHYSPLHYPLHLSILLLAQHTLNFCLFNCICTVQIVLVWALVSNFIIQPTDFQSTFVHITLLRLHSLCIFTCVCVCLDRIYHHASKQNVCKSDWKNWVFSCRKRRWCSIFHSTCNVCPHLCPVAPCIYLHTISVFLYL